MNELQIFNNPEFGSVRTITKDNEPMFCLADVCKALELEQVSRVKSRLKEDGVTNSKVIDRLGREQEATFINEANLYKVIFQSRKPSAERFTDWVTDEVIPSIRKNGGYIANQEQMTPEQIVANALIVAQNIISQKDRQIEEMKPKAEFFDTVADSKTAISMNEVAKVLNIKGYGRNNLFEFLRENKVLDRWNVPYQRYVDNGWFRVIEQHYQKNGEPVVTTKTLVYQKGVDGIRKMINQMEDKWRNQ